MKIFTVEFWLGACINAHVSMEHAIVRKDSAAAKKYAKIATYSHNRIVEKYKLLDTLKPMTPEFLSYLLVNALRNLNEAQRHNLAISLAVRDPLFSIEEYKRQCEKPEKDDRT